LDKARQVPVTLAGARTLRIPVASCTDLHDLQLKLQDEMGDRQQLFEIADAVGMPLLSGASLRDAVKAGRTPLTAAPIKSSVRLDNALPGAQEPFADDAQPKEEKASNEVLALAGRISMLEGRLESQRKSVDVAIERLTQDLITACSSIQDLLAAVEAARDRGNKDSTLLEERMDSLEAHLQEECRNCRLAVESTYTDVEEIRDVMKVTQAAPPVLDESATKRLSALEERCSSVESSLGEIQKTHVQTQDRVYQRYEHQAEGLDRLRVESGYHGQNLLSQEFRLQKLESACSAVITDNRRTAAEVRRMVSNRSASPPQTHRCLEEEKDTFPDVTVAVQTISEAHPPRSSPCRESPTMANHYAFPNRSCQKAATFVHGGSIKVQTTAITPAGHQEPSMTNNGFACADQRLLRKAPTSPTNIVSPGSVYEPTSSSQSTSKSVQSLHNLWHGAGSASTANSLPSRDNYPGTTAQMRATSDRSRAKGNTTFGRTGRAQYVLQDTVDGGRLSASARAHGKGFVPPNEPVAS